MVHVRVLDDGVQDYLVAGHREAVAQLVADLTDAGLDVELEVRPPTGAPMASAHFESVIVIVTDAVAGTLATKLAADAYDVCKRWVQRRRADKVNSQVKMLYGADGKVARTVRAPADE